MTITVSTDGSALGNPNGPMGWAWADHAQNAARTEGHQHDGDSDAGGATNGTNQIGELCAVLEALRAHTGSEPLTIETDSQYAINCSTKWVHGWKRNGWRNSQKKPVKNAPLIKAIDTEISKRKGPVKFVWVKGHNGNPGNEKVDDLAHTYSGDARSGVKDGYLPLEGWQSLLASDYAKGVDIPADAQMLIDGTITGEQYHLGRGESSTQDSDTNATGSDLSSDRDDTGATSSSSLPERLSEPEGVPDYDFDKVDTSANGSDTGFDSGNDDKTNASHTESSDSSDTNESVDGQDTEGEAESTSGITADKSDNIADAADQTESGKIEGDDTADTDISDSIDTIDTGDAADINDADHADANAVSSTPHPTAAAAPARPQLTASGLTASGTVMITPPPQTSPTFDGRARHIKGMIAVNGYVNGDGNLQLNGAPFFIIRS